MSKGKHSEAEMIGALKQMEAGRTAADVARELGVSKHTIYAWKAKYGGLDAGHPRAFGENISTIPWEKLTRYCGACPTTASTILRTD